MLNIPVVLGSVREERSSLAPANFLVEKLKSLGHNSELVDFKSLPLPFFDSALVPVALKGIYPYPNVQKWSEIAKNANGFVLILPEYNHSYTAVIKNALDWLYMEFEKKPFGLVGVSTSSFGATRAIEHMRPIIGNFDAMAIRDTLNFGLVDKVFSSEGKLLDENFNSRADRFLQSLIWWTEKLKTNS